MFRVTTPTHVFNLPFEADTIDKFILTYKQAGNVIVEKTEEDDGWTSSGKQLMVKLTQEETSLFADRKATVQLRVKIDDTVMASNIIEIYVTDVLNEEVM